ncbi:sensor histidine kinase [Flavihumibacter petaseus]|nr:HAMP domain-containing sensor histidine kinase [Flavihumibacter petaseus]
MRPLLYKTTRPFLIYVLVVLVISVPVYYLVVDAIWRNELDEHNEIIAGQTAFEINRLKFPEDKLQQSIKLWNDIQPGTNIRPVEAGDRLTDSTFTIDKARSSADSVIVDRFRCLSAVIYLNGKPYRFTVETNIEETRETIALIAATTIFFFLLIVAGLLYLTRKLSDTVWKPFHNTLNKLKVFNLNSNTNIEFNRSDTMEFEELNLSLRKLIDHSVTVYKSQKEFTENASHELQTPLAILKSKLDLLMQSENLTEQQYLIAEDMNRALIRSSRINKNLLLLAKIENSQFETVETVDFSQLVRQNINLLSEHFTQKNIVESDSVQEDVQVKGNSGLIEVLIQNLVLNAIRHSKENGDIQIILTKQFFEVANSGTHPLNTDNLFGRFIKATSDNGGSGLGLSIVQEVCKYHGWRIHYSFEDAFHRFTVTF